MEIFSRHPLYRQLIVASSYQSLIDLFFLESYSNHDHDPGDTEIFADANIPSDFYFKTSSF